MKWMGEVFRMQGVVQKGGTVILKNNGLIKLRNKGNFEMEQGAMLDLPYGEIK